MEKTSRCQQMTRPTQKTGERRGNGKTKADKDGGWGVVEAHPKREDMEKWKGKLNKIEKCKKRKRTKQTIEGEW